MSNELITNKDIVDTWKLVIKPNSKLEWKISELGDEVLGLSLEEIGERAEPNDTLKKIRSNFHYECKKALSQGLKVQVSDIVHGICGSNHFLKILDDPYKLAYILVPYPDQKVVVYHQSNLAMDRLTEILSCPVKGKDGELDLRVADRILKAVTMLYDRIFPLTQKIITESKGSNQTIDLEEKIKKLEQQLGKGE